MAYQTGTAAALLWNPVLTLAASISVFISTFGHLAGNTPAVLAFLLLLALISIWESSAEADARVRGGTIRRTLRSPQQVIIRILVGALLLLGCLYGMFPGIRR